MNAKHAGWVLLVGGAAVQIAETMGKASAQLNGLQYQDSKIGAVVAPLEKILPLSLGWTMIMVGAALVWVVPHLGGAK
jgi:hypothetical protein